MCHENESDLQYSEVPLKEKNKTLVKSDLFTSDCGAVDLSSTQDDPRRSNIGGRDPCNPCGVDAYAVTDRRLRPRCCHLGSYFQRPKSSPVRPLACNWYYCAHSLLQSPRMRVHCASGWRRCRATLAYEKYDVIHKNGSR